MQWYDKMQAILVDVMGPIYFVFILSPNKYTIHKVPEGEILTRESTNSLESHWRYELSEGMKTIFNNKIESALSKI